MRRRWIEWIAILSMLGVSPQAIRADEVSFISPRDFICSGYYPSEVSVRRAKPAGTSTLVRQTALVIFAKFEGEASKDSLSPAYAYDLFDPDLPGSLSHFYDAMSFGWLQLTGSVLPKRYESDHPASFYVASSDTVQGRYGLLVQEILRKVDADVDFGEYDNDGPDGIPNSGDDDGYLDLLFINLRSIPRRFLWGPGIGMARLGLAEDWVSNDLSSNGVPIKVRGDEQPNGPGGCVQQVWGFQNAAGVIAHEYGHLLGLPDLYDTSFLHDPDQPPEEDSAGIGKWGLMGQGALGWHGDDGPVPFCAWSREQLGWSPVEIITGDVEDLVLEDVEIGGTIYKIQIGTEERFRSVGESDTSFIPVGGEYFLIEYRSKKWGYYDRNMPGEGVLIWHVGAGSNNRDERRKLVDLECADGRYDERGNADPGNGSDDLDRWAHDEAYTVAHGGNLGDAMDVFDGERYTAFTLTTNPSSDSQRGDYGEASTGISITDIRREGGGMVMDVHLPRWFGSITRAVRWFGEVNVIGDVVVEESGSLTLAPNTVVRFASGDTTHGGLDPDQCELLVKGRLDWEETARFMGMEGVNWLGIGLGTRSQVRNILGLLGGKIENAEQGIFYLEPWSGTYTTRLSTEPLLWFGTVDITGDVIVDAPLVVLPGTVVRFAPTDDQHGGDDPERCELILKQTFSIHGTSEEPIRFTSLSEHPSDRDWYGIRLSEAASEQSLNIHEDVYAEYGISHYIIEHAQHGLFWEGHLGEPRLALVRKTPYDPIYDHSWVWPGGTEHYHGNGDGQVNAGENPLISIGVIRNFTSQDTDSLFVAISTDDPFVRFCPFHRRFPCIPPNIGKSLVDTRAIACVLTVTSDAPAGHAIVFRVDFAAPGIGAWQDTVVVEIAEGPDTTPPYTEVEGWPMLVEPGCPIHLRAVAADGGQIARVTAQIWTDGRKTVDQVQLRLVEGERDLLSPSLPGLPDAVFLEAEVFEGEWIVPSEGVFYAHIEAEDVYGNQGKSANTASFSSKPFVSSSDMVLVAYRSPADKERPLMMRALDQTGLSYDFWNTFYRGPMDSSTIARCRGDLILWLESRSSADNHRLIAHLRNGGRLLLFPSYPLSQEDDLATYLGIGRIPIAENVMSSSEGIADDPITDGMTLHGDPCLGHLGRPCYVLSALQPETVPILEDTKGHILGVRVEKDGYKAVYFGKWLGNRLEIDTEVYELIARAIQWLRAPCTFVSFEEESQPTRFALHPNHPNPFNTRTVIPYDVPEPAHIRLSIYNLLGQEVRVLADGPVPAGHHIVRWDGQDDEGHPLASGIYLCRLRSGSFTHTRKMALIR